MLGQVCTILVLCFKNVAKAAVPLSLKNYFVALVRTNPALFSSNSGTGLYLNLQEAKTSQAHWFSCSLNTWQNEAMTTQNYPRKLLLSAVSSA